MFTSLEIQLFQYMQLQWSINWNLRMSSYICTPKFVYPYINMHLQVHVHIPASCHSIRFAGKWLAVISKVQVFISTNSHLSTLSFSEARWLSVVRPRRCRKLTAVSFVDVGHNGAGKKERKNERKKKKTREGWIMVGRRQAKGRA